MHTLAAIDGPLSASDLWRIDAHWRAANHRSVGRISLLETRRDANRNNTFEHSDNPPEITGWAWGSRL